MPPLSLLVKPVSGNCNLKCRYCFYHSITEQREIKSYGKMSVNILEKLVEKGLSFATNTFTIAFQGGEPTLAGLDFYKNLVEFEKKHNLKGLSINNAIQTNGIIIDEKWAEFMSANNFLVGLSLDGPKDINDLMRIDNNQEGVFNRIMNTIRLFDKYRVEYNILCVVNNAVARHAAKVYSFFRKKGFKYLQFLPCLDPLGLSPVTQDFSLTAERYAAFLKTTFDLWYKDLKCGNMISVRHYDNYTGMVRGYPPEMCGMNGVCNAQFVVEADGSTFPCDFYVMEKWKMGNILDNDFNELKNSEACQNFIKASLHKNPECIECRWQRLCNGGCRRMREPFSGNFPVKNIYCQAYKDFFEYAFPRMRELADIYLK